MDRFPDLTQQLRASVMATAGTTLQLDCLGLAATYGCRADRARVADALATWARLRALVEGARLAGR